MATLVSVSLDVTKITKSKIKKGQYLDVTVSINDETNQYGQNVAVYESQSKEERESKNNKNFIGNGKVVWTQDGTITLAKKEEDKKEEKKEETTQDLPF